MRKRNRKRSRDAHHAPTGSLSGAEFDKRDSKGVVHRFRVTRVGPRTVDLAHVGSYTPRGGWTTGSGDVYPASSRVLASMTRVTRGSRDFGKRREYVPQGEEARGYAAARYAKLIKRHRRHKAYNASTQYQGHAGAGYDQKRGKRR